MNWYLEVLRKYAVFTGRVCRAEYWMFVLVNFVIACAIGLIEGVLGSPAILANLYGLAILIPALAVSVRRLHDTGRSGWWLLIGLVPVVGLLTILVFMLMDSQSGANSFGANPQESGEDYIGM